MVLDGRPWKLRLPQGLAPTEATEGPALTVGSLQFHFEVSRNEEYVRWWATAGEQTLDLGDRTFNYTLLILARERLSEADGPDQEAGWLDRERLLQMLALEPETLRVHLYRARKMLSQQGVSDAAALIERRSSSSELRIGTDSLTIR